MSDFFYYFRTHFDDFVDDDVSHFNYFAYPNNDQSKWFSSDPITSLFSINIPVAGGIAGDDGTVICSDFNECCHWVFSTIKAPQWGGGGANDGSHPVSGNRQFGYTINLDGSYSLFTKGADRANRNNLLKFLFIDETDQIYTGGHTCWSSLISGLDTFLAANGTVVLETDLNTRGSKPTWSTIKNILQSSLPITEIPCH
jgi:hypothetical protein